MILSYNNFIQIDVYGLSYFFGSKCDAIGIKIMKKKIWLFEVKDFKGLAFVALIQLCRHYLVYFQVRGSNIHETMIFDVIFHILEVSGGRWASALVVGRLCFFFWSFVIYVCHGMMDACILMWLCELHYICIGWHDVMRCGMNEFAYVLRQYELYDSCKAMMVSLPRGLCWVRVKRFHSFVSLYHELSKSAPPKALLSGWSCC